MPLFATGDSACYRILSPIWPLDRLCGLNGLNAILAILCLVIRHLLPVTDRYGAYSSFSFSSTCLLRMVFSGTSKDHRSSVLLDTESFMPHVSAPTATVVLVLLGAYFNEKPSPLTGVMTWNSFSCPRRLWPFGKGPCSSGSSEPDPITIGFCEAPVHCVSSKSSFQCFLVLAACICISSSSSQSRRVSRNGDQF